MLYLSLRVPILSGVVGLRQTEVRVSQLRSCSFRFAPQQQRIVPSTTL